jgi:hypothetical protein
MSRTYKHEKTEKARIKRKKFKEIEEDIKVHLILKKKRTLKCSCGGTKEYLDLILGKLEICVNCGKREFIKKI